MGEYTPNYGLYKPDTGETDWGDKVNQNFDVIDTELLKREPARYPLDYSIEHDDETLHTITSTSYETLHEIVDEKYDGLIGTYTIVFEFRTTGNATAYVQCIVTTWLGDTYEQRYYSSSTTSTTFVMSYRCEYYLRMLRGRSDSYTFRLSAKTSDSSVPAEVRREIIYLRAVRGVKP